MVHSPPIDTSPQIPEVVLSDTEEFEDMDILMPSTDESTHMLPVSVEWYGRQNALSVKTISRDSYSVVKKV